MNQHQKDILSIFSIFALFFLGLCFIASLSYIIEYYSLITVEYSAMTEQEAIKHTGENYKNKAALFISVVTLLISPCIVFLILFSDYLDEKLSQKMKDKLERQRKEYGERHK